MRGLLKVSAVLAVGAAFCGSAAYGGWTIWSNIQPVSINDTFTDVPVAPRIVPVTPVVSESQPALVVEPAVVPFVVATPPTVDPVKPAETRKELPKGKNHDAQAELLAQMARVMHSEAFNRFIMQPGEGMNRVMPTLKVVPREWKTPMWTSEELAKEQPPILGVKDLNLIHRLSLKGFGDPSKSSAERYQAMAKEAYTKEMKKEQIWEIKSLDLVGLVVHESPVAYVSDKLPDMKDLKNRPTRELDVFESEGLEELMSGKAIYIREKEGTVRVLGPIHASKTCLKCHSDTKEGTMLGAFSYTLRPGRYSVNRGRQGGPEINSATPFVENPFGGNTPPRLVPTPKN